MNSRKKNGLNVVMAMLLVVLGALALAPLAVAQDEGVQRGIDADAARYTALGQHYQAGIQRGIEAGSARYAALGRSYSQGSTPRPYAFYAERMRDQASRAPNPLPYTDVAKFYAERMRAQAKETSALAANPELIAARNYRSTIALASDEVRFAANPELIKVRQYETCSC